MPTGEVFLPGSAVIAGRGIAMTGFFEAQVFFCVLLCSMGAQALNIRPGEGFKAAKWVQMR